MLCALCLSMFHNGLRQGLHHTSLKNLQKAADDGCKICSYLILRRDRFGPDLVQEETAFPFLKYHWHQDRSERRIQFDSNVSWLRFFTGPPYNQVDIHVSDQIEKPEWWYIDLTERASDDLKSQPWQVRRETFPSRPIPNNTGHPDVMRLARRWLRNCENYHNCETLNGVGNPEWCPKRLIDLSDPTAPPRLLDRDFERPKGRYAALSHCWGPDPEFVRLRADNLDEFHKNIPSSIPQSFHDAISICRHLGIHYLWIDSICILQAGEGSDEDWILHTGEMTSVYANCYLNLSFAGVIGPENGALTVRNPDFLQTCYGFLSVLEKDQEEGGRERIKTGSGPELDGNSGPKAEKQEPEADSDPAPQEKDSSHEESSVSDATAFCEPAFSDDRQLETWGTRKFTVLTDYDQHFALKELPLFGRGWTLQERLLSPRILHFMRDRVAWECGNIPFFSEYLPSGLNTGTGSSSWGLDHEFNLLSKETLDMREKSRIRVQWTQFIREYTERHLTHPEKDKLVAFAAVAQRYAATLGERYLAGHFRSEMPKDLVWMLRRKHIRGSWKTDQARRAPTWSWASVDGRVIHLDYWQNKANAVDLAEVLDVQVELVNQAYEYGPVKSGHLWIRGLLIQCRFLNKDNKATKFAFQIGYDGEEDERLELELTPYFDDPNEEFGDPIYALPLVRFQYPSEESCNVTGGVFLKNDQKDTNKFRRIGAFSTAYGLGGTTSHGPALTSDQRMTDYCRRYSGRQQIVAIV